MIRLVGETKTIYRYGCPFCDAVYPRKSNLPLHLICKHGKNKAEADKIISDIKNEISNQEKSGREKVNIATGPTPATLADFFGPGGSESGDKVTLGEDVAKLKEELNGSMKRIDAVVAETIELSKKSDRLWTNFTAINELLRQTIEGYNKKMNDYEEKLRKLHICPDCGNSLHMHLVGEKTGTGNWHLECPLCGYCSEDYGAPKWKGTRRHLFATKPPESLPTPPENTADKKPTNVVFVVRGAKAN